jgi:GNAT superfamily N-acetyltransferase
MDLLSGLTIVEFGVDHAEALVRMWRASFEYGVGVANPHPLADQREYLFSEIQTKNSIRVAVLEDVIVGFVAANRESLSQLYVRVGFHRKGIGTRLLNWAKGQSDGSLWLYTFARNLRACAFYEKNGFIAVARGFEPMWGLEDIRFEWHAPKQNSS